MPCVSHIVVIRVNETSWVHVWMLHFRYLGTGCDKGSLALLSRWLLLKVLEVKFLKIPKVVGT
jgi:hypothetical protein